MHSEASTIPLIINYLNVTNRHASGIAVHHAFDSANSKMAVPIIA